MSALKSFLARGEKPSNSYSHMRAKRQEKQAAKRLNGQRTPGSGNKMVKGDVRARGVLRLECKTTKNASFSVTREMVEKIEAAGLGSNEIPAILIEFNNGAGKKLMEVAVIPSYFLDELTA